MRLRVPPESGHFRSIIRSPVVVIADAAGQAIVEGKEAAQKQAQYPCLCCFVSWDVFKHEYLPF